MPDSRAPTAVLASANEHKLSELARVLDPWRLELLDVDSFPPEAGGSYHENAAAKARFGRAAGPPGAWVLGEDSGIEVNALGGRPGLSSNRWAAAGEDHVEKLLAELEAVEPGARGARYVCELVGIPPAGEELRGRGVLEGAIAARPSGSEGFGYDPVFIPAGETRTVAELGDEWKSTNSHRARAARALLDGITPGRGSPRGPAPTPALRGGSGPATS